MSLAGWLNAAWMLKAAPEAWAFRRATRCVAQTQAQHLNQILRTNANTEFGHRHRFARLASPRDYQGSVPLSVYEDYAEAITRIGAGEQGVLTQEPVRLLEPTSGTSAGEKLIPYTQGLRRQFQRGIAAWIADLFWNRPALRQGRAYWSISPALGTPRRTPAGIPIGFDDDSAYLGRLERFALERLLVVPSAVARVRDVDTFRYRTLLHLLSAEDLTLISIWSPTFLTALLDHLENNIERLLHDLRFGTALVKRDPAWAGKLQSIFEAALSPAERLRLIWPRLALISCWTDAAAAHYLPGLRQLFPHVEVQPKGLLATEGFVSFPLCDQSAPALAVRSHFFEFQETAGPGDDAQCRLAHDLDRGGRYRVILTTAGGLYRYQLRDEIEVIGFLNQCPLIRFLGKADCVSDLVGEKLAETHVRNVLEQIFHEHDLQPRFALVAPVPGNPPRYRLYLQHSFLEPGRRSALVSALEAGLQENPHYRYAIGLGQLVPAQICFLPSQGESAWAGFERHCLAAGQRAGNIKPRALDTWTGWDEILRRDQTNDTALPELVVGRT